MKSRVRPILTLAFWLFPSLGWVGDGGASPGLPAWLRPMQDARSRGVSIIPSIDDPGEGRPLPLLPDLRTMAPSGIEIQVRSDGRFLRLANTVWNSGPAPLELQGDVSEDGRRVNVHQLVMGSDGMQRPSLVGEFVWHPRHDHWHMEDFARYELWSLTPVGELDRVVAGGAKVSYCLIDTDVVAPTKTGFVSARTYRGCGHNRQGLSVGWGDTYAAYLAGQEIFLGDLPDGVFALVSTVNPNARLREADYGNNEAVVYLAIVGRSISLLRARDLTKEACLSYGRC